MRKRMDAGGATCAKVIQGARASRLLLTADQLLGGEGGGHENAKVFRGKPDGDASPSGGGRPIHAVLNQPGAPRAT